MFFLFLLCSMFVVLFFCHDNHTCRKSDHRAEVFGGDFRLYAPPLFLGILIFIQ